MDIDKKETAKAAIAFAELEREIETRKKSEFIYTTICLGLFEVTYRGLAMEPRKHNG